MTPFLSTLKIAWRNLGRNTKRSALALLSLALAQFFVLGVDGFMAGYEDSLRDLMTGPLIGHVQIHAPEYREKQSIDLLIDDISEKRKILANTQGVERTFPRIFAPSLAAKTEEGFTAFVTGIDFQAERQPGGLVEESSTTLKAGRLDLKVSPSSDSSEEPQADYGAIVGEALAKRQDLKVGDQLALIGQTVDGAMAADLVRINAIIRSNLDIVNAQGILIELEAAQSIFAMPNQAHEITIRGQDAAQASALAERLRQLPALKSVEILPWEKLAPELVQMMGMMNSATWVILVFVFVAAAAGIANTMLMSTFERTREFGVLLALGSSPRRINLMLLLETILIGVLGLSLGTALGASLTLYLGQVGLSMADLAGGGGQDITDLSFQGITFNFIMHPRLRPSVIEQSLLAMGVTCLLSALWPIHFVNRLAPTEAMRK
ncbi:MAG: FtsX-like permease family protein [Polyangiaceae bacterium]|nr:FtsX-like permease family protein [Polyangiaceae bacterium]